uniref:Uncharacterized protein n=1 Tax=Anguilla anguilla TaxID=7936 RepID=A0A0E9SL38_ANGAN
MFEATPQRLYIKRNFRAGGEQKMHLHPLPWLRTDENQKRQVGLLLGFGFPVFI